jgi:ABC-type Fe3+ transport system permease subunit
MYRRHFAHCSFTPSLVCLAVGLLVSFMASILLSTQRLWRRGRRRRRRRLSAIGYRLKVDAEKKRKFFFVLLVFLVCRFCFCCLSFLLLCIPLLQWAADGDSEEDGWRAIEVGAGVEGSNNGSRISNFVLGFSSLFFVLLGFARADSSQPGGLCGGFFHIYRAQHAFKRKTSKTCAHRAGHAKLAEPPCA